MFRTVLVLGHFRGIRIEIHISWVVILTLLLVTMSAGLHQQYPDWPLSVSIATALVTALLFFTSIVAHELGHSLVAIRRGIPVQAITLFIFGGMAQMSRDSEKPNDEFWIAIAGPLVSLALALMFGSLALLTAGWYQPLTVSLGWLAMINLIVALFNMIPGFPLDGGRVFRAVVWKLTGDARKGINAAVQSGRVVAYLLFAFAFWNLLMIGNLIGGIWILLIGWFLLTMAEAQGRMFDMREQLLDVRAGDLADTHVPLVSPDTTVSTWIDDAVLRGGHRAFVVGDRERVRGLISLSDIGKVERSRWPETTVAQIMTSREALTTVKPEASAQDVLQLMIEHDLNQIPVMTDERVVGWINREQLLRTIQMHRSLKA
jgi:Zn-dependent protease/CBS domain-containing protein